MEPRQSEKSSESRGEVQISPDRQPERRRRFQIVKLEERIAPGSGGNSHAPTCNNFTPAFRKCSPG
jgi:hypothetical protein